MLLVMMVAVVVIDTISRVPHSLYFVGKIIIDKTDKTRMMEGRGLGHWLGIFLS